MTAPQELGVLHQRVLSQLLVIQIVHVGRQAVSQLDRKHRALTLCKDLNYHDLIVTQLNGFSNCE